MNFMPAHAFRIGAAVSELLAWADRFLACRAQAFAASSHGVCMRYEVNVVLEMNRF